MKKFLAVILIGLLSIQPCLLFAEELTSGEGDNSIIIVDDEDETYDKMEGDILEAGESDLVNDENGNLNRNGIQTTELKLGAGSGKNPVLMQASSSGHWEEQETGEYQYECQCGACFPDMASINQHQFEAALNGEQGHTSVAEIAVTERVWVEDPEPEPELHQPVLIAAYNGAKGIGIKFHRVENATEYMLYRKFNGVWSYVCTFSATDPALQISGTRIMYTDTSVAGNYGKGYIYSVAAKRGSQVTSYDTKGVAIYRLTPPSLTKITNTASGKATVTWKGVFGRTETNGAYDLQIATEADAKASTDNFVSVITRPGYAYNVTSATVSGLKKGTKYVFRIRCSKTNKDRGTYYSEYSKWMSVVIGK